MCGSHLAYSFAEVENNQRCLRFSSWHLIFEREVASCRGSCSCSCSVVECN